MEHMHPVSRGEAGGAAVVGRGLRLAYGHRPVLDGVDFAVPGGRVTAVIGPNGSGKSTLLHAVAGLLEPAAGSLEVLGTSPRDARRRVAYVLQATRVNERIPVTVREVVTMGRYAVRGAFGRLTAVDHAAVGEALERLALTPLAGRHLRELSGGERQRVFVAQGLVQDAELLLLDEPVTALDLVSHERIDTVIDEERRRGRTVVVTTHEISEARRADHVLLLGGGRLVEGSPEAVLTDARLVAAYGAQLLHVEAPLPVDDAFHRHDDAAPRRPQGRHR